ncbi:hypothetical protein F0P96_00920 [Hymenobacter busanensis]|uniref:Uncharacterized protein n=1 Tax=Hymenobacter busanensis TaxID=2607656 RepID=A0A7L4ZVH2_9BACT|nr:hypothetical protein [Hymenobacter busanensis]KAA9339221.1 hypothetical protein F0P96_00920 [Hymenobacter busanensis]QHJ07017.1 hypothetical protein GUY19_06830 [Hymenobacter busanensis]
MKTTTILTLLWTLLWLPSCSLQAQDREATEKISRQFTIGGDVSRATLALYNINGSVTVQGYSGKTVQVEITKTIKAPSAELLAQGQKDALPGFDQHGDSVLVYVAGPQDSRPNRDNRRSGTRFEDNWRNSERPRYSYQFDFTVKVPAGMEVRVSTVNGGKVLVEDVTGPLQARNVNGSVSVKNAQQATLAHTVNGDVDVSYTVAPTKAASYHTINGNITVSYPSNVSGDLYFKSMHGEMFTDFPKAEVLPARVSTNQQREGQGTKYKLSKETAVRLGKGGMDFRFETINGNVTIKQQTR